MLTEEKFEEKAKNFFLFKNVDGKYFTPEEYETLIKENQTDKDGNLVYLYTSDKDEQYTFIQDAKNKGYDVIVMDDVLSTHLINKFEQADQKKRYVRIDSDVVGNLIQKEDETDKLSWEEREELSPVFQAVCPANNGVNYMVDFKPMGESAQPMVITRNEFMRRMKDMSKLQGGGMNFYGDMPESLNLVVNTDHPLVKKVLAEKDAVLNSEFEQLKASLASLKIEQDLLEKAKEGKQDEEVPAAEKEKLDEVQSKISALESDKRSKLEAFGKDNKLAKQMVDLALLANGLLKGADLDRFVRRSVELMN